MGNSYVMGIITQIGVIITALLSFLATIIQLVTNKKAQKSEDIIKSIHNKIDKNTLNQDKRFLIQFMDKAEKGETISDEEIRVAFETKTEYNKLGGDSYVDTKWDKLIEKEILKLV